MFENIIGQAATLATLRQELREGSFPAAALLHGPPFCGKLSTALEITRVLTCAESGEWACGCPSCRKHRLLVHPNTLLLGQRYFELEIAAAADVLRRAPRRSALYLYIRAVRKLTRRFDPVIWEGEENKLRPLEPALAEVEERLDRLAEARGPGEAQELGLSQRDVQTALVKIQSLVRPLLRGVSADTVPVAHLRRAAAWLHRSSLVEGSARKVVIVENADRMQDASANSLLTLLEEPPAAAHLILTTTRRGSLIPTILSRLRPYLLRERGAAEERQVLERIFQEQGAGGLREYFLGFRDVNPQQLQGLARRFVEALGPRPEAGGEQAELLEELRTRCTAGGRSFATSFLEEVQRERLRLLSEGGGEASALRRESSALRWALEALEGYNQSPALALEALFYTLRGRG